MHKGLERARRYQVIIDKYNLRENPPDNYGGWERAIDICDLRALGFPYRWIGEITFSKNKKTMGISGSRVREIELKMQAKIRRQVKLSEDDRQWLLEVY